MVTTFFQSLGRAGLVAHFENVCKAREGGYYSYLREQYKAYLVPGCVVANYL